MIINNLNNQPLKFDPKKKATISIFLGTLSLILSVIPIVVLGILEWYSSLFGKIVHEYPEYFLLFSLISGIGGITFGFQGLNSKKRNFAIMGMLLCIVGISISIFQLAMGFYMASFQ